MKSDRRIGPLKRLAHWWDNLRGNWHWIDTEHFRVIGTFNAWAVNLPRPYLWLDGDGEGRRLILFGINYGNGNSDPVWALSFEITGWSRR